MLLTKVSPLGAMVPGTIAAGAAVTTGTNGESHESLILQSSARTCDDHLLRNGNVGGNEPTKWQCWQQQQLARKTTLARVW